MRVIVTRPAEQAAAWVAALLALGVDAAALPLIGIAPPADAAPVLAAWTTLAQNALVVFVSPNAVQRFFALRPAGLQWPAATTAGATGPGTSSALRAAGVAAPLIAEPPADAAAFDSESLWTVLARRDWAGSQVLVVRGEDGRDWLADTLGSRGARVGFVAAYRREPPLPGAEQRALLQSALAAPRRHLWLFSSSEAIGHLQRLAAVQPGLQAGGHAGGKTGTQAGAPAVPPDDSPSVARADATAGAAAAGGGAAVDGGTVWSASIAAASHPRIVQTAHDAGFGEVALLAPAPEAVLRWLRSRAG